MESVRTPAVVVKHAVDLEGWTGINPVLQEDPDSKGRFSEEYDGGTCAVPSCISTLQIRHSAKEMLCHIDGVFFGIR